MNNKVHNMDNMNNSQLKTLIIEALINIAPDIKPSDIPEDEDLRDALDLDSMDFLRLLTLVNQRTGVTINEADYRQVLTLNTMIRYLLARGITPN
jgi:acyl carrier protein